MSETQKFFEMIIAITKDGGYYLWPDAGEVYKIKNGKLYPKTRMGYVKLSFVVNEWWLKKYVSLTIK